MVILFIHLDIFKAVKHQWKMFPFITSVIAVILFITSHFFFLKLRMQKIKKINPRSSSWYWETTESPKNFPVLENVKLQLYPWL